MKLNNILITLGLAVSSLTAMAQTDVTKKYLENPGFEARFAAWVNPGSFTYNVANTFEKRDGQVWLEKWVAKTGTLGNNDGIYQTLRNLPSGTYTLTVAAKNISQANTDKVCTGAYLYAGTQQTEINQPGDYSVTFTVANGKANVGVRLQNCTGNWVCIDNFRLQYNGEDAAAVQAEQARLDAEKAALEEKIAGATHTSLKVTTYPFVPTGNTIALGRSTISGTHKEEGFCWSTQPGATIFDDKTTETFDNNGKIYVMRGLKPATPYYVRAYAMTNGGYLVYGDEVKIVTLPAGNMTYGFFNDNNGDAETCARINSASAECIWMYNQLSYIPGFYLSVHYVPGAGAGGGTADCSYGGWMRVSQNVPYQQTGTMLHETNHGVGVGTTGEWYNNANLRADVSRGLWLGPMGTKMVRFFENSTTATMTGDGTHMWPYGINGANEDRYQPSNHCLYFANILITHALHQDGLPSTRDVGFASPAYVFEQRDSTKYYIKSNDEGTGLLTGFLCATTTAVKWNVVSAAEAKSDDSYAWYIKYDPTTRYYYFQNVGTGKMITYNAGFKLATRNTASAAERMHLMPARVETTIGSGRTAITKTAYWVMQPGKYSSQAMEATTSNGVKATQVDLSNGATKQQWIFFTADEIDQVDQVALTGIKSDLQKWIAQARTLMAVGHKASTQDQELEAIDAELEGLVAGIETAMPDYTSPVQGSEAIEQIKESLITFISKTTPTDASNPYDLTFLIENPAFDKDASGWSETAAWGNGVCEFYQKNFDFNQTLSMKMPVGTYELHVQAFQRPGTLDDIALDYFNNQNDKVNATLYLKTKNQKIQNIGAGATDRAVVSTGSTFVTDEDGAKHYIPNTMASAASWFKKDYYDTSVRVTTTSVANMKFGIKSSNNAGSGFWTLFDNFRLYYYGAMTQDDITPVQSITLDEAQSATLYDLTGRKATQPARGIYVKDGRNVVVK